MAKFGNENWKPIHVRDNFLFLKGSVKGFETQGSEQGVNAIAGPNSNPGGWPDGPAVIAIATGFGAAAQQGNIRAIDVETLFNFAGSTTITAGQSVVAVRGCISVASVTTLAGGFVYGVQGKIVAQGTIAIGSGFAAALFGQYDTSNANVVLTSGYNAALVLDMGATSHLVSSTVLDAVDILNTTNCLINSVIRVVANASYFMDLTDVAFGGLNWAVSKTAGANAAKSLKIKVGGTDYYIPLSASAT